MQIRAADAREQDLDQDIVDPGFRDWNFFEPESRFRPAFD
jgi:hypothetical protein